MNKQESDVLSTLLAEPFVNQRVLSEQCGHSLGIVNRSLKKLIREGYVDESIRPTEQAINECKQKSPRNAIILAAGFGMRMVPINTEVPKALLEVNGEPLIERIIRQLHEAGITQIYVVVGFLKEQFEYLMDLYGVELIVNEQYAEKNNLHSLHLASDHLCNTYIVPCDIWCAWNPFHRHELYSWYMVSDLVDNESMVRVNRKMELVTNKQSGNQMIGITYLIEKDSKVVKEKLEKMDQDRKFDNAFWEEALIEEEHFLTQARVVHAADVVEINTYEQLRELDEDSNQLKSEAIDVIATSLDVEKNEIRNMEVLKKGMTNRSFLFTCRGKKYIMRIPGEGTDQLINREEESEVYEVIRDRRICDDIVFINPENGYKITAYLEGARVCDPKNEDDLKKCMKKLREFHGLGLKVDHTFDIFGQMEFYETLWKGSSSIYRDYEQTKAHVLELRDYIGKQEKDFCLTHIDAVPDNFLFVKNPENGQEEIRLIDWEYAGMQDPHVDIAMFCIYSLFTRDQVDHLIDLYFEGNCPEKTRIKIYCYIAVCGLLWSNWCEYKRMLGVEFGEYSLRQYRYAKDYYRIVQEERKKEEGQNESR